MPLDDSTQIPLTVNGITINVWDEKRGEVTSSDGKSSKAVWQMRCAWSDRLALAVAFAGGSAIIGGTPVMLYPVVYPDNRNLTCLTVTTVGEGLLSVNPDNGFIDYDRCELTANFGQAPWDPNTPGIGSQELEFSSHSAVLDNTAPAFKWTSDMKTMPNNVMPVLHYTTVLFTQEVYNVPSLNALAVAQLVDTTCSSVALGAPSEQLIFRGMRTRRKLVGSGATNWDEVGAFEFHPFGWNKLPRPGSIPLWQPFTLKDGSKLFPPVSWSILGL